MFLICTCSQQCYASTFIQVTAYYFFCWTHNCVSVQGHIPNGPFQSALLWDCFSWLPPDSTMYWGVWKDYIAATQTLSLILDISTVENSILEVVWDGSRGRYWTHLLPQTQKMYSYLWNKQKPLRTSWAPASQQKKERPKITRRGGERRPPKSHSWCVNPSSGGISRTKHDEACKWGLSLRGKGCTPHQAPRPLENQWGLYSGKIYERKV